MEQLQQFAKQYGKKTILLKDRRMIFHVGDEPSYFYFLESGYVKIFYEAENGQTLTLSLCKPGEFFGMAELFSKKGEHEFSATSIGEVTFYAVTYEQVLQHVNTNASLWSSITKVLASKLMHSHQSIIHFTSLSVPERLATFLQQYAKLEAAGHYIVDLPLSHEEISYVINCSRQKVTNYLNKWRKEGFISYERGKITIRQPDALFNEA